MNLKIKSILVFCSVFGGTLSASGVTLSGAALTNGSPGILSVDQTGYLLIDTGSTTSFSTLSSLSPGIDLTSGDAYSGFTVIPNSNTSNLYRQVSVTIGGTTLDGAASFNLGDLSLSGGESFGFIVYNPTSPSPYLATSAGDSYGIWTDGTWKVPSENGATLTFGGTGPGAISQLSDAASINGSVIPEPSAYATILGLLGLGYVVFCRRRRSSSRE